MRNSLVFVVQEGVCMRNSVALHVWLLMKRLCLLSQTAEQKCGTFAACWDFLSAQLDKEILDKPHSVFFPSLRRSSPISGMYSLLYMWQAPLTRADSESCKSASLAFASSGSWSSCVSYNTTARLCFLWRRAGVWDLHDSRGCLGIWTEKRL